LESIFYRAENRACCVPRSSLRALQFSKNLCVKALEASIVRVRRARDRGKLRAFPTNDHIRIHQRDTLFLLSTYIQQFVMPPNVLHSWDSNASKQRFHVHPDEIDDNGNQHNPEFDTNAILPPKTTWGKSTPRDNGRALWEKILQNGAHLIPDDADEEFHPSISSELFASLSDIVVLSDDTRESDWLNQFRGRLTNVSTGLLEGLRKHAPDQKRMSTVADFNDNLFYHMQQERGLRHFHGLDTEHVEELETVLNANEYLGSFLTTKCSLPQPAHVDYPWEVLEQHAGDESLKIGFFPLTKEGMFLQIWPTIVSPKYSSIEVEGQIIFIPYGKLLTVPASTIHGGGFRTNELRSQNENNNSGNLRFHLYIATNESALPVHQTNKYTEPYDRTKELSRRYVDSRHMNVLLENFFV